VLQPFDRIMSPAAPHLELRAVSVAPAATSPGLHAMNLALPRASLLCVLGSRGSGKGALLAALAGFIPLAGGEIRLDQRRIDTLPPGRRGIALLQPEDDLFATLDVAANLALPLRLLGLPRAVRQARVAVMLADLALTGLARRRPAQLGALQRRLVSLGRALISGPALLLLDQPLASLDAAEGARFLDVLREQQRDRALAVVVSLGEAPAALRIADQIAVLHEGRLLQQASPATLYEQPASLPAALALGEANLLLGTVETIEDGLAEVRLDCGPLMTAQLVDAEQDGRCLVLVRPERVAVALAEMGGESIRAVLRASHHLGDHLRLRLALEDGLEIVVRRPPVGMMANLAPGASVSLAWQSSHARAFRPVPLWPLA
jgi:putative spermidine/putrescine transport system ATP-binding protein